MDVSFLPDLCASSGPGSGRSWLYRESPDCEEDGLMVAEPAASSHTPQLIVFLNFCLYMGLFFQLLFFLLFFYFLDFTHISRISKCWVSVRRQGAGTSHNLFGIPAKRPLTQTQSSSAAPPLNSFPAALLALAPFALSSLHLSPFPLVESDSSRGNVPVYPQLSQDVCPLFFSTHAKTVFGSA